MKPIKELYTSCLSFFEDFFSKRKNLHITMGVISVIIVLTLVSLFAIGSSAEEPLALEPRATSLQSGEYTLNYQSTIPSSLGYFEIDVLFTELGYGYENGMTAPYGRIKWDLANRTLSIFTYPDYEELVLYRDGEWLSRQAFSIYLIGSPSVSNSTYAERFTTLYSWERSSATVFNASSDGYTLGLIDGYNTGYELGYTTGYNNGVEDSKPFANIIGDVFDGLDRFVIYANFSLLDLIKSIMGVMLAVWLLRLLAGG